MLCLQIIKKRLAPPHPGHLGAGCAVRRAGLPMMLLQCGGVQGRGPRDRGVGVSGGSSGTSAAVEVAAVAAAGSATRR